MACLQHCLGGLGQQLKHNWSKGRISSSSERMCVPQDVQHKTMQVRERMGWHHHSSKRLAFSDFLPEASGQTVDENEGSNKDSDHNLEEEVANQSLHIYGKASAILKQVLPIDIVLYAWDQQNYISRCREECTLSSWHRVIWWPLVSALRACRWRQW